MLRNISFWQLLIIVLAIVVLIGWKRLPDAARSLGRSLRIFKSEVEQLSTKDDEPRSAASGDTVRGEAGEVYREGQRRADAEAEVRAGEADRPGATTAAPRERGDDRRAP